MLTEDFIKKYWLILVIVSVVIKKVGAKGLPNECTISSDNEIVCEGLNSVPPLDYIDEWSNTERISLTNGSITFIPAGYFNLSNLEIIDLRYNLLETFNMTSLEYATELRTINLTGNPIVCDNNIHWLKNWKTFYSPGNRVDGTCADSREDINTYLSNKTGGLVKIKFSNSSLVFGSHCNEIFVPFTVIGGFASPLEYRAFIQGQTSKATLSVVTEHITIPVGKNIFNITVTIRGEDNEVDALLQIISKYPVSYEANVEIQLRNGVDSCTEAIPIKTVTTQSPSSLQDASETLTKNPRDSASPIFVSSTTLLTVRRETISSAGTTPSLDHTQAPEILQSQGPTLNHESTAFPVPTTQRPKSTRDATPTVKNGPEGDYAFTETVPVMTVTTQNQSASQGASERVTQKPKYGTSPPIPSMPMSLTDTAEPTQEPLSTVTKPATLAEHTLTSKIIPTPEPTAFQEPRNFSVSTLAPETTSPGKSPPTVNKGRDGVSETAQEGPKVCPARMC
ncbi:hypothetical protein HOLleu_04638 [Holothuria leucospilota]|uniref:Uncharacterized protein n=1 Tax=Holothuria leucospilota TaxID=206669 RepID=A0A9Q1CU70_HOLLE|nr:hypothetical protein HOLleu_04638 [Holothuria leucospilota]